MKLFAFGDSWTEGVGFDFNLEKNITDNEEKTRLRNENSWPKFLSDLLKIKFQNFGCGASSNKLIFDCVCGCLKNNTFQENDLVVIMWSSSLRDDVSFFPSEDWFFWGKRYITKKHILKNIISSEKKSNLKYSRVLKEYKEFFFDQLFTDSYYQIINQNYILFIQFMLDNLGVKYVFCDAFDNMIFNNIENTIDKSDLINKNNYWGFKDKTFKDFLIETNNPYVWEGNFIWNEEIIEGVHPNKNGYKLIANELFKFILDNKILEQSIKNKNYLL